MNNQEIIDKLFDKLKSSGCRYPKWELIRIIDPFLEVIKETLEEGDHVRLTNFGKFAIKTHKGRKFYNIQSGRTEYTSDKKIIAFTPNRLFNLEKSGLKLNKKEGEETE